MFNYKGYFQNLSSIVLLVKKAEKKTYPLLRVLIT